MNGKPCSGLLNTHFSLYVYIDPVCEYRHICMCISSRIFYMYMHLFLYMCVCISIVIYSIDALLVILRGIRFLPGSGWNGVGIGHSWKFCAFNHQLSCWKERFCFFHICFGPCHGRSWLAGLCVFIDSLLQCRGTPKVARNGDGVCVMDLRSLLFRVSFWRLLWGMPWTSEDLGTTSWLRIVPCLLQKSHSSCLLSYRDNPWPLLLPRHVAVKVHEKKNLLS